ncbi:MAG: DNA cytosine methyltransferase [Bradymonadales bacterium]
MKETKRFNVIELFSGAGGLALGLHQAGFDPLILIDFYEDANRTLKINHPHWNVKTADIHDVATQGIFKYVDEQEVDLLSGGFPCQPFSYAGKQLGLDDTRGTVFHALAKIISDVKPKLLLLENVRGLTTHDAGRTFKLIKSIIRNIGYTIDYKTLNAWNYGVAQKRERLIIIGIRQDYTAEFTWPSEENYKPVLRDVLKNVPPSEGQAYPEKKRRVLELVPPGGSWADLPDDIARDYLGKSYYSGGGKRGMARRLSWDEPSLTLTCSPAQKQTERCHPDETRPFTVREYARIQGFPDTYQFHGSTSSQYKQIGNAVPVNLAFHIGKQLFDLLIELEEASQ